MTETPGDDFGSDASVAADLLEAVQPGGPYRCLVCAADGVEYEHAKRQGIRMHIAGARSKHKFPKELIFDWGLIDPDGPRPSKASEDRAANAEREFTAPANDDGPVVISLSSTARRALVRQTADSLTGMSMYLLIVGARATMFGLQNRSEALATQMVILAERNPAVMKWLRRFNATMAGGELARLGGELAMCAAYDAGVVRPDKVLSIGPMKIPGSALLQPVAGEVAAAEQMGQEIAAMVQAQAQAS